MCDGVLGFGGNSQSDGCQGKRRRVAVVIKMRTKWGIDGSKGGKIAFLQAKTIVNDHGPLGCVMQNPILSLFI